MLFGSFTAFVPAISAATPNLTVSTQTNTGSALTGYWAEVTTASGALVQSGFSMAQFTLAPGSYDVSVGDYGGESFSHWADGTQARSTHHRPVHGHHKSGRDLLPNRWMLVLGRREQLDSWRLDNGDRQRPPNGSATIQGMYVDLRLDKNHIESGFPVTFSGLQTRGKYLAVVYWYGDYYFRHFSNGNLQRYAYVTLNATGGQTSYSTDALYRQVPTAQAVSLNIRPVPQRDPDWDGVSDRRLPAAYPADVSHSDSSRRDGPVHGDLHGRQHPALHPLQPRYIHRLDEHRIQQAISPSPTGRTTAAPIPRAR
jgi:hypothetical protein